MAKREDKENKPTRRVFKSSDVHRRRVGDSSRQKPAKMPTKREARESARESTRIAAESRTGKARDQRSAGEERQLQVNEPSAAESASKTVEQPRFRVIKGPGTVAPDTVRAEAGERSPGDFAARAQAVADRAEGFGSSAARDGGSEEPSQQVSAEATQVEPQPKQVSDNDQQEQRPKRRSAGDASLLPRLRPRTVAIAVVMVLAVIAVAAFAFNRWGRYDDHADLQGTWYVLGTEVPIQIDDKTIRFNEEVSYEYQIDAREKTISYTFGPMSGQGRYWFSDDRKHLVITDGDGYTAANTTVDDLIHAFLDFSTATGGGVVELPRGEGIIAFSRTPEKIVTAQPAEGLVVEAPSQASENAPSAEADQPAEEEQPVDQEQAADEVQTADEGEPVGEGKPAEEEEAA